MPESKPKPKRRWYRLTPDRFVIGLLAAEGFLFLADRFAWFALTPGSGWNVLLAVALICLAVLIGLLWLGVSLAFRRRFQYSLRTLFVFVMLCAVLCSWFAVRMAQAKKQREVVEAIRKAGGAVYYEYDTQELPGLAWLRGLLGDDFFSDVVSVSSYRYADDPIYGYCQLDPHPIAYNDDFGDGVMVQLRSLPKLESLELDGTKVTDAGLVHLKGLTSLQDLHLDGTQVTDAGVEHLKGLTSLRELDLFGTKVTDAGLEHLKGLANLLGLGFASTQVTDAGLEHLKGLTGLRGLVLADTKITDAGLEHLKGLTNLVLLHLPDAKVTDAGVEHLKGLTSLRELDLSGTKVTDAGLEHLKRLTNLRGLGLAYTKVTDAGLEHLKGLTNLKRLKLQGTQAEEGIEKLLWVLPNW